MPISFEILILFLFSFCVRLIFFPCTNTDDIGTYRKIFAQKGRAWINYKVENGLFDAFHGYPSFVFFLISKFPEKYWIAARYLINYLSDILIILGVFFFLKYLDGFSSGNEPFLASLIFASIPVFLPRNARMIAANSRPFGLLLVSLYFVGVYFAWSEHSVVAMLLSGALIWLIILSSQFALQAAIFYSAFMSVLLFSPIPVLILLASGLAGCMIPGLMVRETLWYKINHWAWYFKVQGNSDKVAFIRSSLVRSLFAPIKLLRNPRKAIREDFGESPYWIALTEFPLGLLVLYLIFDKGYSFTDIQSQPIFHFCFAILIAGWLSWLLTAQSFLYFLGEAERYLEYCAGAAIILFFILLQPTPELFNQSFYYLFPLGLIVIFMNLCFHQQDEILSKFSRKKHEDELKVLEYFRSLPSKSFRIAVVPIKRAWWLQDVLLQEFGKDKRFQFYFRLQKREGEFAFRYFIEDTDTLHSFKPPLKSLAKKYDLTHFIYDKMLPEEYPILNELKGLSSVFSAGRYVVIDLKSALN